MDAQDRLYVMDTGNKRVVVFNEDGTYVSQFGGAGLDPGLFDEPVGIAIDANGAIYIADTWNQRIQTFMPSEDGLSYTPLRQWDVDAWYGQSLENKPFIAVDNRGHVFITDPEGCPRDRVHNRRAAGTDLGRLRRHANDHRNCVRHCSGFGR